MKMKAVASSFDASYSQLLILKSKLKPLHSHRGKKQNKNKNKKTIGT